MKLWVYKFHGNINKMGKDKINENDQLFPNLSFYNRAVSYPYFAPNYSFSFFKGQFVKEICFDLDKRIPILSVGSNRSPYQLKRKFSLNQNICVTPATLYDSDVVYAASLSAYGSIPATQWPCEGAKVDLNVLWLNEIQLNIMHLSEALGVAYNFVKLKLGTVKIKEFEWKKEIYGYMSVPGAFSFNDNKPKRLLGINAQNSNLKGIYESEALIYLKNYLDVNDKNLSKWLRDVINDKIYRLGIHKILESKAIKPQNPNCEILETNIKGELII